MQAPAAPTMFRTPHFETEEFESHHAFLDDDTYGKALDTLVKACSDVMIESADGQRLFVGRRKVEPQPDWWFVGGRARPGDTTQVAAARNVRRDGARAGVAARRDGHHGHPRQQGGSRLC